MFDKRCEVCGAGYLSPVESDGLCEMCEAGEVAAGEVEPETVEVCPDCFDVFAVMGGATDWETDPARFDRLAEMFDGCRVGDVSAESVGFSRYCDTCDTVLQGDRFRVDILPG